MLKNKKYNKQKKVYIKPLLEEKDVSLNFFFQKFDDGFPDFHGEGWALLAQASTKGYSCFSPKMRVVMGNKTLKEIRKIREGDQVLSYDYLKKTITKSLVISVLKYEKTNEKLITINNVLEITIKHPLFVTENVVKHAGKLKVGDELLNTNEQTVKIISIKPAKKGQEPLYNLKLDGRIQNYFVENILVFTGHQP